MDGLSQKLKSETSIRNMRSNEKSEKVPSQSESIRNLKLPKLRSSNNFRVYMK